MTGQVAEIGDGIQGQKNKEIDALSYQVNNHK
jgi:hypothetical protein